MREDEEIINAHSEVEYTVNAIVIVTRTRTSILRGNLDLINST